ncbi:hypothetical protein, partial [Peribacillus frigoritolerans]|uniref:hypothetical protein n=1 Tax=Peribacillus frigoritolerans TaxID=450367 RepID=UPI00341F1B34
GESRGGSPTARGKRVPGVEINVQIVQAIKIDKLDFHRVCLQSATTNLVVFFLFIRSNIRYIFLYIKTSSCLTRKNKDMHVIVFKSLRNMDLGTKEGQHITVLWLDCEWYHSF